MLPALRRDSVQVLDLAMREHGDIVNLPVPGRRRLYVLNHPDLIRHVLQDNQTNYARTPFPDRLKPALGKGLLNSEGEVWHRQRRLMQPVFNPRRLLSFVTAMASAAEEVADRWEGAARRGDTVPVMADMSKLALAIVMRATIGHDPEREAGIAAGIATAITQGGRRFRGPFGIGGLLPTPANLKFRRAEANLIRTIDQIIAERGGGSGDGSAEGDLLDGLLSARDPDTGGGMRPDQVRNEVMTIFLAGHETTATALAWTCVLLSQYPATAERLYAEVAGLLGTRMPEPEDLERLTFTRMVVQESLRLYPPVPWFGRVALGPDRMADYDVPTGTTVLLSPYVMQRHPLYWDYPEHFVPERFAPAKVARRPPYLYFPFGGGPRICIGSHLALIEMQAVIAVLIRRFRLHPAPQAPAGNRPGMTMRPSNAMAMHVERRIGIVKS